MNGKLDGGFWVGATGMCNGRMMMQKGESLYVDLKRADMLYFWGTTFVLVLTA